MANDTALSFPSAFNQQFIDKNGKPLAYGRLYTYVAGSNTPAETYKIIGSISHTNTNTNPIILDMAGRADLVLRTDLSYRIVLRDRHNALVKEWDKVMAAGGDVTPTPLPTAASFYKTIDTNYGVGEFINDQIAHTFSFVDHNSDVDTQWREGNDIRWDSVAKRFYLKKGVYAYSMKVKIHNNNGSYTSDAVSVIEARCLSSSFKTIDASIRFEETIIVNGIERATSDDYDFECWIKSDTAISLFAYVDEICIWKIGE